MEPSPSPFDAAAEAARFCAAAAALREFRTRVELHEFGLDHYGHTIVNDRNLVAAWRECEAAGVTLAELYGVAS
jgi:hypothetical protein